ncbi:MAG: hypothetical protein HC836_48870 [Richelia sp. RM2_1_2]|nr:hypothetical protein [Richelia sp. RM1_1_1]NJO65716.1 hypothetical protein [Richelia sp. RM2_1_2]
MASIDIFGNKNDEEFFDSSLLDNSAEDTYGLNSANKVDKNTGTEPLAAFRERLKSENFNIAYNTDNIGDDTVNSVLSPFYIIKYLLQTNYSDNK